MIFMTIKTDIQCFAVNELDRDSVDWGQRVIEKLVADRTPFAIGWRVMNPFDDNPELEAMEQMPEREEPEEEPAQESPADERLVSDAW